MACRAMAAAMHGENPTGPATRRPLGPVGPSIMNLQFGISGLLKGQSMACHREVRQDSTVVHDCGSDWLAAPISLFRSEAGAASVFGQHCNMIAWEMG